MKLDVYVSDVVHQSVDLAAGAARIGSDPGCHVVISHPEVAASVATLDVTGDGCRIQNLCPYDVYVGQQPLASQAWAPWPLADRVYLTRSISLAITPDPPRGKSKQRVAAAKPGAGAASAEPAFEDGSAGKNKQLTQISIICGCVVLGAVFLLGDSGTSTKPAGSYATFLGQMVKQPDGSREWESLSSERRRVAVKMQDAWEADLRRTRKSQDWAVRELQELLDDPAIQTAPEESLEGQIRAFANWRLSVISSR